MFLICMICMIYELYDLAHVAGWGCIICMMQDMFPTLDLFYTDPAQHLTKAGQDLVDDLDHDLSDLYEYPPARVPSESFT